MRSAHGTGQRAPRGAPGPKPAAQSLGPQINDLAQIVEGMRHELAQANDRQRQTEQIVTRLFADLDAKVELVSTQVAEYLTAMNRTALASDAYSVQACEILSRLRSEIAAMCRTLGVEVPFQVVKEPLEEQAAIVLVRPSAVAA